MTKSTLTKRIIPRHEASLRRIVSLPWLVLYGLGSTVGAGVYALTGIVAERAGFFAPIAFALAALLALCTGLSFAELSARFPRAGGALVYVHEGLRSRSLSVIVGLLSALAGVVSSATVSRGFVGYLSEIFSIHPVAALLMVVGSVGALAAWGVRESVIAAGTITIVEVLGLLAVVAFGATHLAANAGDAQQFVLPTEFVGVKPVALMSATILGFFAFMGFEDMVNIAEEVEDVRKAMPRAIVWTLGLSTLLYVSVATVAVLVVPPSELGASNAPLSLVFERSGGSGEVLALIALAAMLNGALVQIIMASRILFSLSRDGPLPGWIGTVNKARQTPIRSTCCITSLVAISALALPLESLASATAGIALAVFTLVNLSLFVLRLRNAPETSASPPLVSIGVPIAGALLSFALLAFEISNRLGS